ncbi:MAG TPA: site-specific integrase [Dehalococcoidia bacterium]|nr:site-specific integrase [Dehalococcoidia bacterium]
MQTSDNNSFDAETKQAIALLITKMKQGTNDVHIKTQEVSDSFLKDCRDRELSHKTISNYTQHIKQLVGLSLEFPPEPKVIQQFFTTKNPHNADSHYRTWRALGNYAKRKYEIPNFMDKVHRPKVPNEIMPTISDAELGKLAMVLRNAPLRDKAILVLFVDTAIRSGEAANLKREDILEDRIIVHGKTGFRVAPLSSTTRELLLSLPSHEDGYIFYGKRSEPLGLTGFYKVVKKYLKMAGYRGNKQFGTQILRRSFGRFHLLDGGDMQSLSLILGHKNITTTAKYYAPLLVEDIIKIHHKHTPARVFENTSNQRVQELAVEH